MSKNSNSKHIISYTSNIISTIKAGNLWYKLKNGIRQKSTCDDVTNSKLDDILPVKGLID